MIRFTLAIPTATAGDQPQIVRSARYAIRALGFPAVTVSTPDPPTGPAEPDEDLHEEVLVEEGYRGPGTCQNLWLTMQDEPGPDGQPPALIIDAYTLIGNSRGPWTVQADQVKVMRDTLTRYLQLTGHEDPA